jgi:hypothetical protein
VNLGYSKDIDVGREDFSSATRYVLANAQPGDAILFYQPIGRMPYEYYRSLTPAPAYPIVVYPAYGEGLTFRDFYAGKPPESLLSEVPFQHARVWVVLTHNLLLNGPDPTTKFISAHYSNDYSQIERSMFSQIELRLYCRHTGLPDSCPMKSVAQPR